MDYRGAEHYLAWKFPQGKVGEPSNTGARLISFLVSEEATVLRGAVIYLNGGYAVILC